jgi:putative PIN family toxin of toxin-antitoxin system
MASDGPKRIVLDTNILVSAFLFPRSIPGRILDAVLGGHRLLMSITVAAEVIDVMRREKFDSFLSVERRDELVASLIRDSELIETATTITSCRDLKDNKILELAVDGNASVIVTGDSDLLTLHPFQKIAIISPRNFLQSICVE